MEQKPDPTLRRLSTLLEGRKTALVLNVLIVVLVVLALLLPPVSAQERILDAGYKAISREVGGSINDRAEQKVQLTLLAEGLQDNVKVKLQTIPKQVFMTNRKDKDLIAAAQALTTNLHVKSDIYKIGLKGKMPSSTIITIPIPNDSEPYEQISLYDWTGTEWKYLPSQVIPEDDVIEAHLDHLPHAVAVLQNTGQAPVVSAELPDYVTLPETGEQALAEVNPLGYYLNGDDNKISGKLATLPAISGEESFLIMPTVRNWYDDGLVRSDWIDNLLVLSEAQETHIAALVDLAEREMYAGIDLDYRGISPDLRAEYTAFVTRLAEALHAKGKRLTVHVDMPTQIAEDRWETGAYDWRGLGAAADRVKFPVLQNPAAYAEGGQMQALLWWAVSQVDRAKLQPVLTARSVEDRGGTLVERTYRDALAELCDVAAGDAASVLTPGEEVKVQLEAAGILEKDESGCYSFSYTDDASGQTRTVWLEDASSLARKLALLRRFSLGGIAVRALWDEGNDPRVWDLVREYQAAPQAAEAPADSEFSVLWTVANNGQTVNEETRGLDQSSYTFVAQEPGQYAISASIVANGGKTVAGGEQVSLVVALPTDTPTPVPTETPTPTPTPTPAPTATRKPAAGGGASAPAKPAATKAPVAGGGGQGRVNTNFGYGIQIDTNSDLGWVSGKIKEMGFGWVKFQAPWTDFESSKGNINWGSLDQKVNGLAGLKIMLSIVKAPHWARGGQDLSVEGPPNNPQDFADFLGAVAGRYCNSGVKAIEVWNEQNLHYEWGNLKIDPAAYMALLKPAYNAIKRACPSMIVVSGALTPTGAGGRVAMDDFTYLEGMYKAGLKGYCDAVGAHPSGYNVGPTAKWTEACTFITQNGNSFNGPCRNPHHSWSFYSTLNGYHNIMSRYGDGNKKIWPTEFGWATDWTGDPNYGYALDNSREEQAAWTVKSYQLMKSWGWVGTAFLWNLNFKMTNPHWEGAQWGILNNDGSGTQTYNALKSMAK
jgi:hypothetical protein